MHSTSNTAINQTLIYGKVKIVLFICIWSMLLLSFVITKCWHYLSDGRWWTIVIIIVCVFITTLCVGYLCWLPKNVDSNVGHQVPASPYLSVLNCLFLCLMLAVVSLTNLIKLLIVFAIGKQKLKNYTVILFMTYFMSDSQVPFCIFVTAIDTALKTFVR